jgi:hypothetical protein
MLLRVKRSSRVTLTFANRLLSAVAPDTTRYGSDDPVNVSEPNIASPNPVCVCLVPRTNITNIQ